MIKSRKASLLLLILGFSSLLEVYANEAIYFVKSIDDATKYILLFTSILGVGLYYLKSEKINVVEVILSITLAVMIVYLPNALISFYF